MLKFLITRVQVIYVGIALICLMDSEISLQDRRILILGAGAWQVPYLVAAKQLGLKTYVTDWSTDPVGARHAHVFEPIDLKDQNCTLAFAKQHGVEGVFTAAEIGVTTAAYVAARLELLYHPPEVALAATNKYEMRKQAREIDILGPEFHLSNHVDEAISMSKEMGFPLVLKPLDNCACRGVAVVRNREELVAAYGNSTRCSTSGQVLVESLMTGREGSIEAIVDNGRVTILGICDKVKAPLPYRYDIQLNYPGDWSVTQHNRIITLVERLVQGFNIRDGIIHVEVIVDGNCVKLIEFAVRCCGSHVVAKLIPAMTGFDVMEYLFHAALGIKRPIRLGGNKCGVLKFIMLEENRRIKHIRGLAAAKQISGVLDLQIERKTGDNVGEIRDGRSRPGLVLAVGANRKELDEIIGQVGSTLDIGYFYS